MVMREHGASGALVGQGSAVGTLQATETADAAVSVNGVECSALVGATAGITATVRRNFAVRHLSAADHFAAQVEKLEVENAGNGLGSHFDLCTWNATAAIILAFAAIEATVDEAEDDLSVPDELAAVMEKAPTLDHVQAILVFKSAPKFDKGTPPYQAAQLLGQIRNGLVHGKAEWDHSPDVNARLSKKIIAAGLPLSPFWPQGDLAFPHGCMSGGVARWAADSSRAFIRDFRARLGLVPTA